MDREQEEMQFLGLFDIYIESYKIIFSWRKIFSKITIALILPLSFIFLAHMEVFSFLSTRIMHNKYELDRTRAGTQRFTRLSDLLSSEWAYFVLFKILYFTFFLIFSLLSTSAVVYTVASIYTSRELTFKKIMCVVPKVWKRLMVTFLCTYLAFFVYNFVAVIILIMWAFTIAGTHVALIGLYLLLVLYLVGFLYLTVVWQLASVVSVLEDKYGIQAMVKSKELIKGKLLVSIVIFFKLNLSLVLIQILFGRFVIHGQSLGLPHRVGFGILCFLLLLKLYLFILVIQTIIYFVCKSYHHENIDKSALSDHLEVYLGEYVPLTSKDVQLEQYHV